eukprot:scaffold205531_cov21-Tisochrysis_lutea.AAC.3
MHLLSNIKNPAGTKQGSIAPRKAAKGPWSIKQGSIAANAANEPRENCSLGWPIILRLRMTNQAGAAKKLDH